MLAEWNFYNSSSRFSMKKYQLTGTKLYITMTVKPMTKFRADIQGILEVWRWKNSVSMMPNFQKYLKYYWQFLSLLVPNYYSIHSRRDQESAAANLCRVMIHTRNDEVKEQVNANSVEEWNQMEGPLSIKNNYPEKAMKQRFGSSIRIRQWFYKFGNKS